MVDVFPFPAARGGITDDNTQATSIELDQGVGLSALTSGADGPVISVLLSLTPRRDGMFDNPDAALSFPIGNSGLVLGQTTGADILDRFGGYDSDPDDLVTPIIGLPSYKTTPDASDMSRVIVSFRFDAAQRGRASVFGSFCGYPTADDATACLNDTLATVYV